MSYNEYYAAKLKEGEHYQDFVVEELYKAGLPIISYSSKKYQCEIGENKAGIEIKNDQKFRQTGNFYIEVAEKSNPDKKEYSPSGIYRDDNTWLYIIGDYQSIYIFSKKQLQFLFQQHTKREVVTPTSKGFLLPIKDADEFWAVRIMYPQK